MTAAHLTQAAGDRTPHANPGYTPAAHTFGSQDPAPRCATTRRTTWHSSPARPWCPSTRRTLRPGSAFLEGLKILRGLDGNPQAWHCTRCDKTTPGDDIRISYDVGDTPIPYCPNCPAYGPELKPTAA